MDGKRILYAEDSQELIIGALDDGIYRMVIRDIITGFVKVEKISKFSR